MLNLVLFGAPGAGKGTQASRLVSKYGFNHISTGEIIRQEIRQDSELGRSMKDYIARGEFAPDELVIDIIEKFIENHPKAVGNIFDGFPRTLAQAEAFDRILKKHNMRVASLLSIDVPDEMLRERLLSRGAQSHRADDANVKVINNRLHIYKKVTEPVLNYYKSQGKHISSNGVGSEVEVYDRLCSEIDKLFGISFF